MCSRQLIRRLPAVGGAVAVATAGLVLGAGSPAQAVPPELAVEMVCGALDVRWTSDPLDDDVEPVDTVVLRNDVVVEQFTMLGSGFRRYGAADGDIFVIRRAGERDTPPVPFRAPDGCADSPVLQVSADDGCAGPELTVTNLGTGSVDDLLLVTAETFPVGETLAPVPPGTTELAFALPDGARYELITGPFALDAPTWMAGTYTRPSACDAPSPTPTTMVTTSPAPASPTVAATPGGGGAGGELPVTGTAGIAYAVSGVALVAAGLALVAGLHRRRIRFVAGDR
ncbi:MULTISPECIES: hypothetical protein [unclassified Solwaraspora]|uniref:hypothetical protein n=1 Tax=unclassified Solwaraspora TaxID=2627926 RepID=UPI00259AEB7B|nr:hypothetical protein [Solwaraspora sp. WMMA2056]WJK42799.1 hypothetical protein O7608_10665 [Solwaraspora sp. WMMA2056]